MGKKSGLKVKIRTMNYYYINYTNVYVLCSSVYTC